MGVRELGVGGERRVEARTGGEDQQRPQPGHDPGPCEQHGPREGEPQRRHHGLAFVAGGEEALCDIPVALPAPHPQNQDQAQERQQLERGRVRRARHQVERTRRRARCLADRGRHPGRAAKARQHDPGEGDRAQHSGHELQQVGDHDAPQPGCDRVDESEPHAHGEGQRGVPSEQHIAEFDHCQHHPPHDDRVFHQPLVHGREATQDPRGGTAVADLDDLGVGEDTRAAPQPRIEEGQHEDAGRLVPPQPVAVDALAPDERGGGERCIGGEPGGRDRGACEPPGQRPAGHEVVFNAAARAFGEAQADGEGDRAVDGDDNPVKCREGHLGRWLASTGAWTEGMENRNLARYAASATCVRDAPGAIAGSSPRG